MRAVLCVALVLCAAFVSHAAGAVTLRGQRLVQYDAVPFGKGTAGEPGAQHYGSRTTKLRGAVEGTLPEAPTTQPLVIEASELPEDPTQLLNYVQGGLVVLLPEASTSSTVAKIRALEKVAATTQQGAVFVVPHHANTTAFRELRQRSATAIHAVGEAPASRNLPTSKTTPVTVLSLDLVTVPKAQQVAVVAGFDTLGAFPGAPQSPASAADAAALIELATLFAPSTTPEKGDARGLSFILASGHRHSYHGVKQWLAGNGSSALQRFDTVICLESIVGEPKLTIHTARDPTKDESAKAAIDAFGGKTAVNVVVKRVDAGQSELRWAHEVFAHRGVSAVTVSAEAAAQRQLLRSSAAEADRAVDSAAVAKVVNTVAKAIQQLTKLSPSGDADATRLATTLATVNQLGNPRPSYSMPARVVPGLQQLLSTAAAKAPGKKTKVRKSEHPFAPPEAVFFSPDEVVLLVYPSVPITFELTITAAIVAAMSSVSILLLGPSGFVALLKAPFTSSKKKQ